MKNDQVTKIETGFLTGNMGDWGEQLPEFVDYYTNRLEKLLKRNYPNAAVIITHQNASGSIPSTLKTYVEPMGYDSQEEEYEIDVLIGNDWEHATEEFLKR